MDSAYRTIGFLSRANFSMIGARMAQLTENQVRHIAKLARLELSDAEVAKLSTELTGILGFVDMLQEVDTKNVEPTAQSINLSNVLREDQVYTELLAVPEELIATSPLPIVDRQIKTPSAHG
jgi:aspartyl-tRNA(Asn)/glutamyl-tRNA(Gln) amidotransferase subunit C